MSRIRALFVDLPCCTAKVSAATTAWHKASGKGQDDGLCRYPAKYEIDDRNLCTRHAGQRALQILTELKRLDYA